MHIICYNNVGNGGCNFAFMSQLDRKDNLSDEDVRT